MDDCSDDVTFTNAAFVVLHHTGVDEPHYDLMFETASDGPLKTFRTHQWPIESLVEIARLRDHRRFYLTHQGPVPGDRGQVIRVDEGTIAVTCEKVRYGLRRDGLPWIELVETRKDAWIARPGESGA